MSAAATQEKPSSQLRHKQKGSKSNKDVKVQARMDASLKSEAEAIFTNLGMSPTQAIRAFYAQVRIHRGIPFDLKIPNDVTLAAMAEAENPDALETMGDDFFDNL